MENIPQPIDFKVDGYTTIQYTLYIGDTYEDCKGIIYTIDSYLYDKHTKEVIAIVFKTEVELHIIKTIAISSFLEDKVKIKTI